jgi:hypothetical protein
MLVCLRQAHPNRLIGVGHNMLSNRLPTASGRRRQRFTSIAPTTCSPRSIPWALIRWMALTATLLTPPLEAAATPSISNVQATASSPGTADVTWQTSLPSTSQVVFVESNVPSSASPIDNTLVTDHTVVVPVHPGTTYTYYVVSTAQGVSSSTSSSPTSFSAPSVNAQLATTYGLLTYGATSVYQGHDLYVGRWLFT